MTVISIVKLLHLGVSGKIINGLFALDGLMFLVSAGLSYAAIRGEEKLSRFSTKKLEANADAAFMVGLIVMAICGALFAFELL